MILKQTKNGIRYIEDNNVVASKECTKCGEFKSLGGFHNSKASFAGKKAMCKDCSCEYSRIRKAEKAEEKYREVRKGLTVTWEGNAEDFRLIKPHGNQKTDLIIKDGREVVAKKCLECDEMLPLDSFNNRSDNKTDGKASNCRTCEYGRQKRYYEENPEKQTERSRKYFEANRESVYARQRKWNKENRLKNPEKVREKDRINAKKYKGRRVAYHAKWKVENSDHLYEYRKNYYEENTERKLDYQKQYYIENKEKVYFHGKVRRTREASLPFTLTQAQIDELLVLQGGECIISSSSENLHFEHFIPISWGAGGTTFENCYYMTGSLNASKQATNPFKWISLQPKEYQNNFYEKLVPMLAERNGMSVEGFIDYVNDCEKQYREQKESVQFENL